MPAHPNSKTEQRTKYLSQYNSLKNPYNDGVFHPLCHRQHSVPDFWSTPLKGEIACFYCGYDIEGCPYPKPVGFDAETGEFQTQGVYCSPNCSLCDILVEGGHIENSRINWFTMIMREGYGFKDQVHPVRKILFEKYKGPLSHKTFLQKWAQMPVIRVREGAPFIPVDILIEYRMKQIDFLSMEQPHIAPKSFISQASKKESKDPSTREIKDSINYPNNSSKAVNVGDFISRVTPIIATVDQTVNILREMNETQCLNSTVNNLNTSLGHLFLQRLHPELEKLQQQLNQFQIHYKQQQQQQQHDNQPQENGITNIQSKISSLRQEEVQQHPEEEEEQEEREMNEMQSLNTEDYDELVQSIQKKKKPKMNHKTTVESRHKYEDPTIQNHHNTNTTVKKSNQSQRPSKNSNTNNNNNLEADKSNSLMRFFTHSTADNDSETVLSNSAQMKAIGRDRDFHDSTQSPTTRTTRSKERSAPSK